jgi:bifunctional non-homologous end joining protein LigD
VSPAKDDAEVLEIDGREVRVSSPGRVVFPEPGLTKLDLVRYYLAAADGAVRGVAGRPMVLKRFVKGIDQEAFFQKRAPEKRPDWIETATLHYASGNSAEEVVVNDAAALAWVVNLGCLDLNPHPVRAPDLDHPDELRIDLDPMPGVDWAQIVDVAMLARDVLEDVGLVGWPKTSGSRGMHILVRIEPRWDYRQVRLAAETFAREVERRAPGLATARWWKEERGESVFVDFNQNAKDRTVASAYSVRPLPDARVSTPLEWDEVPRSHPERFTVPTVLERFAERGDPHAGIDDAAGGLDALLALAEELGPAEKPPRAGDGSGRRQSTMPLIEIARAKTKPEALEGLERWNSRHPDVVAKLEPADVLVDGMRGSSSLWYRIRVNLQHVPEDERPAQEPLEVDYDPWAEYAFPDRSGQLERAPKTQKG